MKIGRKALIIAMIISVATSVNAAEKSQIASVNQQGIAFADSTMQSMSEPNVMTLIVVGQGVAPIEVVSPAQAYAMARRAAIADAYRLMAERLDGVMVEGSDYIKDMIVKRTTARTYVQSVVKYAEIADTSYNNGLCEVEMVVTLTAD